MNDIFSEIVELISGNYDIAADTIKPESHLLDDLGLDSVDLFDLIFAIEDRFKINIPTEKWTMNREEPDPEEAELMIVGTFCARIDGLIAVRDA